MTYPTKPALAAFLGCVSALHKQAKILEAGADLVEMDMVCCALEDMWGVIIPLLDDVTDAEGLASLL